jgi:hypothetical protein
MRSHADTGATALVGGAGEALRIRVPYPRSVPEARGGRLRRRVSARHASRTARTGTLRHGHLTAAAVPTVSGDLAEPPSRTAVDRPAALDDEARKGLRLGPGWNSQKVNAT